MQNFSAKSPALLNRGNTHLHTFFYQLETQLDESVHEPAVEDCGYDADDAVLVIREEDPCIEETLDLLFGALPPGKYKENQS